MENPSAFRGLHFSAQPSRRPVRAIAVGAVAALFTLLWWVVPHSALYWLLLPAISVLGWMATYGWREANSHLIRFLQSLEHL
jgi:uncharacterized RDD family membrane protein YckC